MASRRAAVASGDREPVFALTGRRIRELRDPGLDPPRHRALDEYRRDASI